MHEWKTLSPYRLDLTSEPGRPPKLSTAVARETGNVQKGVRNLDVMITSELIGPWYVKSSRLSNQENPSPTNSQDNGPRGGQG